MNSKRPWNVWKFQGFCVFCFILGLSFALFFFSFLFLSVPGMGWGEPFECGALGRLPVPTSPGRRCWDPQSVPGCALHTPEVTLSSAPGLWAPQIPHGAPSASRVNSSHKTFEKIISPGSRVRKIVTSLETAAAHPLLGTDVGFTLANLIFWLKKQILCNFWS